MVNGALVELIVLADAGYTLDVRRQYCPVIFEIMVRHKYVTATSRENSK